MAFVRLGLESANVPHADRYGLLWLERGNLFVEKGTLRFLSAGSPNLEPGAYDIPYQTVSMLLLGPGTTVSHDVFRLAGSHGLGLVAIGEGGVRMYTAPPLSPDRSALARRQVTLWASSKGRLRTVLKMYNCVSARNCPPQIWKNCAASRGREFVRAINCWPSDMESPGGSENSTGPIPKRTTK